MTDEVQIRSARAEDAQAIAAAESATAETKGLLNALPGEIPLDAYREKIAAVIRHRNGVYLVAETGEQLIGHLLLDPMPLAQNSHVCTLTIVVHPGNTGRGVGRLLLDHAIDWARGNAQIEKIELRVRAENQRAIRLYRGCGFEQEGSSRRRLKYSDGSYEDDLMMGLFVLRD